MSKLPLYSHISGSEVSEATDGLLGGAAAEGCLEGVIEGVTADGVGIVPVPNRA